MLLLFSFFKEEAIIYTGKNKNYQKSRHDPTQSNFLRNYRRPCRRVPSVPKSYDYSPKSMRNPKSATSYTLQTQRVASPFNGAAYVRDKLPAWRNPFPVQTIYPEDRHRNVFSWNEKRREEREISEKKEKSEQSTVWMARIGWNTTSTPSPFLFTCFFLNSSRLLGNSRTSRFMD